MRSNCRLNGPLDLARLHWKQKPFHQIKQEEED
jgi:hypothetical protein